MSDPAVVVAMREFKRGLLAREGAQMQEMAGQWLQVEQRLADLIELTARDFNQRLQDGKTISAAALYRLERYKRLRAQARDEFGQYAQWADGSLTKYQEDSARLGLDHSAEAIQLSYWPDSVGVFFDRLPVEAVQNIVGIAGNGRPLGELLRNRMITQDQDVWQRLVNNLVRGTALGKNPRDVARQMKDDLAGGLNKALVIARTEGLRPYREASREQYEKSGVVTGQKRLSAHDGRVCAACIADDGALYSLDEVISDHPNGRCTSVPVVRGMPETTWTAGEDWFRQQDQDTQISILGRAKWEAWRDARFEFRDLVRRTDDPTWGKGLTPRSLADLLKGGRDKPAAATLTGAAPKGGAPQGPDVTSQQVDQWLIDGLEENVYWAKQSEETRQKVKEEIVRELHNRYAQSGGMLTETDVNEFIRQWAETSGDEDMRAWAIQQDAALEFGMELSDYAQGRIDDLLKNRQAWLDGIMADEFYAEEGLEHWERHIAENMPHYNALFDSVSQRELLREMYNSTQAQLQQGGFDPNGVIRLRRGVGLPREVAGNWNEGDIVNVMGNPLESWSVSTQVADSFAYRAQGIGVVLEVDVPISDIVGSARTGFGCLNEGEFVVLGKPTSARVVSVIK